jgi:hypothetical protein
MVPYGMLPARVGKLVVKKRYPGTLALVRNISVKFALHSIDERIRGIPSCSLE